MFLVAKVRPAPEDDNLKAIFEVIVYTMWDP
jgi:hypothetical protein